MARGGPAKPQKASRIARLFLVAGAILSLFAMSRHARGAMPNFPISDPSLEWAVEESSAIMRGTVRPGMIRKIGNSDLKMVEVTLDVTSALKGPRLEQVTFAAPTTPELEQSGRSWIDVLVFLVPAPVAAKANANSVQVGGWTVYQKELNLGHGWIFVLGERTNPVWRISGECIENGEGLLLATTEAAHYERERGEPCRSVQFNNMTVPEDGRLEALALKWLLASDVPTRQLGIEAIKYFNSTENAARLRQILEHDPAFHVDPAEEWTARLDERWWKEFPVREQALNVLVGWKKTGGADAELRTPFLRYGPVSWWFWGIWLTAVLVVGILVWRGFGFAGFTTVVLIGVSLLVIVGWWRSVWVTQAFSYATGGADVEIISGRGRIALLRVQDDAPRHGWAVRRYGADETAGGLWFAHYLNPREDRGSGNFRWAEGKTAGDGYSFSLLQLPYWVVMAVLLSWPFAQGIARAGRGMRKRRLAVVHSGRVVILAAIVAGTWTPRVWAFFLPYPSTPSIEQRVNEVELVVRCAPGELRNVPGKQTELNLKVLEVLKGPAVEEIDLEVPDQRQFDLATEFKLRGPKAEWLFFLNRRDMTQKRTWQPLGWDQPPQALDGSGAAVFAMNGEQVNDPARVLELVRNAGRLRNCGSVLLDAGWFPNDSPMKQVPTSRLRVPEDERLERMSIEWADHPMLAYRVVAARMLQFYRSPENVARLRRLLKDPEYYLERATNWEPDADRRVTRFYEARELAAQSLATWKIDVAPEVRTAGFPYRSPPWARWLIILAAGPILIGLLSRRGGRPLIWRVMVGLPIFLLLPASWLAWRSDKTCDSLGWSSRGVSCELASAGGGASFLRVEDGSIRRAMGLRYDIMGKRPGATWFSPLLNSAGSKEKAGFVGEWGVVLGADPSTTAYTYRLTRVPFSAVTGVLCVAPVLALLGTARRWLRRRRYLRSGRCVACGYDLRGSCGRCPECGAGKILVPAMSLA